MIDWRVGNKKNMITESGWHFASFEIQELLLPQINPGLSYIDEYNDTIFSKNDCMRIKANIDYLLDSTVYQKEKIKFETLSGKLVSLKCSEIRKSLEKLRIASDKAISTSESLIFFGD